MIFLLFAVKNRSESSMYFYGGRITPEVIEIPFDLSNYERKFIFNSYYTEPKNDVLRKRKKVLHIQHQITNIRKRKDTYQKNKLLILEEMLTNKQVRTQINTK